MPGAEATASGFFFDAAFFGGASGAGVGTGTGVSPLTGGAAAAAVAGFGSSTIVTTGSGNFSSDFASDFLSFLPRMSVVVAAALTSLAEITSPSSAGSMSRVGSGLAALSFFGE